MRYLLIILLVLSSSTISADPDCHEFQFLPDGPIKTPTFVGVTEFMLIPLDWNIEQKSYDSFSQMIISSSIGSSIVVTNLSDGSGDLSLKEWSRLFKKRFKKNTGEKVYDFKRNDICIGGKTVGRYIMVVDGPDGENGERDRYELYKFESKAGVFFLQLLTGINEIEEWKLMHAMLRLSKLHD